MFVCALHVNEIFSQNEYSSDPVIVAFISTKQMQNKSKKYTANSTHEISKKSADRQQIFHIQVGACVG